MAEIQIAGKKPKTHLIIPPAGYLAQRWKEGTAMPPLGILSIAAVLEKNGFPVLVTAADVLRLTTKDILNEISGFDADFIGLSITTENRFEIFDLIRQIKNRFPEKIVVVGGPHATMAGSDLIAHIGEIDLAVVGEGEETILDIVNWKMAGGSEAELAKIGGLFFKKEDRPVFSGPRPAIKDLDRLPFPAKHLLPLDKYNFTWEVDGQQLPVTNLMTSRGCPFNCNFCTTPITWGRQVRGYSPRRAVDEIHYNIKHTGARYLWFFDDTFNYNPKRIEELSRLMIQEKVNLPFVCEVRIDALSYDLLARMKEAGCHYISFGIESGSERIRRDVIHKNIPTERIYQVLDWAEKLVIKTTAFFIFSHPSETWQEAQESLKIIETIRNRCEISISILHIYPGTELETLARKKGIMPADFSWSKKDRHIQTLPAAQGDVPLFRDQFTWAQIGELIIKWSLKTKKGSLLKKIPEILRSIHSLRDVGKYLVMGLVLIRIKLFKK